MRSRAGFTRGAVNWPLRTAGQLGRGFGGCPESCGGVLSEPLEPSGPTSGIGRICGSGGIGAAVALAHAPANIAAQPRTSRLALTNVLLVGRFSRGKPG